MHAENSRHLGAQGRIRRAEPRPTPQPPERQQKNASCMPTSEAHRPAILVVDDDPSMCDLVSACLEPENFEVHVARDGGEAWRMLESGRQRIDVIVTDRKMPVLDGMAPLAKVRAHERLRGLPVIFQTSPIALEEIVEGIRAGVCCYLTKPCNQRLLVPVIRAALPDAQRFRSSGPQVVPGDAALRMLQSCEFRLRRPDEGDEAEHVAALIAAQFRALHAWNANPVDTAYRLARHYPIPAERITTQFRGIALPEPDCNRHLLGAPARGLRAAIADLAAVLELPAAARRHLATALAFDPAFLPASLP